MKVIVTSGSSRKGLFELSESVVKDLMNMAGLVEIGIAGSDFKHEYALVNGHIIGGS